MSPEQFNGLRILVVDDDLDILESMEIALSAMGADVATASDGNTAVSMFNAHSPHAVVLDMMLPKRSGFLVLEKIQESNSPPPVVMITANQGRRHMQYALDLGVREYLVKPVPLTRLVDTLTKVLDISEE